MQFLADLAVVLSQLERLQHLWLIVEEYASPEVHIPPEVIKSIALPRPAELLSLELVTDTVLLPAWLPRLQEMAGLQRLDLALLCHVLAADVLAALVPGLIGLSDVPDRHIQGTVQTLSTISFMMFMKFCMMSVGLQHQCVSPGAVDQPEAPGCQRHLAHRGWPVLAVTGSHWQDWLS